MHTLTASRLKAARACARLHHYQYVLGVHPIDEGEALRFGTLWHTGLEAWFHASSHALDAGQDAIKADCAKSQDLDQYDRAKAEILLIGYDARWRDEPLETLAVEQEFRAALINPTTGAASRTWDLAGKIDAIVRDADGKVWIVEHKTASEDISAGSEYWRRLQMDGQISTYFLGAAALGYTDVAGCLYDVVAKPRIRQLKATPVEARKYTKAGQLYANQRDADETPEEYSIRLGESIAADPAAYYQRSTVVRLESELAEHQWDVWQLGRQIREAELAGRAPRNPDACLRYQRTCAYFDVCTNVASLDDETRFRRRQINPELQEDKNATSK